MTHETATQDTWIDPTTGLMWQVTPTGGEMNWKDAKSHGESLRFAGFSDWRLPTIDELKSLIRENSFPLELSGAVDFYWSSSAVADLDGSAWYVYFNSGFVHDSPVYYSLHARCVRSGKDENKSQT